MFSQSGVRRPFLLKVSFVIPSYQQGKYIGQCLDSIAAQNLVEGSFEVIVQDGGSTDGTQGILRNHPLRPAWESAPDNGQAHAVNLAMKKATGDVVAWINSDDYYLPGAIGKVLGEFSRPNSPSVLYGNGIQVDTLGNKTGDYPVEDWNYDRLLDKCFLCQPAVLFHRGIFDRHGPLNEDFHLAVDLEFWLRTGKAETFLRIPETLAAAREYLENKSQSNPLRQQIEALWAGHLHTGKFSKKRLWAIAENRLARGKGAPWISKVMEWLKLWGELRRKEYPWLKLPQWNPSHSGATVT